MPNWLLPENVADVLPSEARKTEELRRALLDDSASQCSEQILTPADLARACAVFFGNSLRGLIPAIPVTDPPVAP